MTKNESLKNLIARDVFGVANMITHYDIEVSDDLEDFMIDWFYQEPGELTKYSFEELKSFAKEVLNIIDDNLDIADEPIIGFSLGELKKVVCKNEAEMLIEKATQIECWNDMENISAIGGFDMFMKKHATNPELLEAQKVISMFLGSF